MARQQGERQQHQHSAGSDSPNDASEPAPTKTDPELTAELTEKFLALIAEAGELCGRVEGQLKQTPAPGART